jgi:putative ABC transport system ATP-binding protein
VSVAPLVVLRGVAKSYREGRGEHSVLRGVDLELARGEFVALHGRSGSGKSTLLNLIGGIDSPSAGTVQVLGRDLARISERERTRLRRGGIGFVFQFFNLIPTLTLEENLLLPIELAGRASAARRARALELLGEVGLADRRRSFPDSLSGGEQQRAALARALAQEPELVLADEPTGNLDDESAAEVLALLRRLLRPAGKTLLLATHAAEAARLCDRVLELREGRLEVFAAR